MQKDNHSGIWLNNEVLANKNKRFANYAIDMAMKYILAFIIVFIAAEIAYFFQYDAFSIWIDNIDTAEDLVISYGLLLIYYLVMESVTQRSVGKYITGTKVIMGDGSKPEAGVIFIRSVCRLIPFDVFSFLGEKPVGWHDSLSKTYVVDIKKYEAEVRMKHSLDEIGRENL